MIRDSDPTNVPAELLAGIRANHKGLRLVELHQCRGRGGYSPVAGERWRLHRKGEDVEHDQAPDDDPLSIAQGLWDAACSVRRKSGGDQRFAAVTHTIGSGGALKSTTLKFDVPVDELIEQGKDHEAVARADFLTSAVGYTKGMHTIVVDMAKEFSEGMKKMFQAQTETLGKVSEMLPKVLQLRMDAADAEIRALLSQLEAKHASSDDWKEVGKNLQGIAKGPVGVAMAAKLLGIEPAEAAKMLESAMSEEKSTTSSTAPGKLRELLDKLGRSLSSAQQAALLSGLGFGCLSHLQSATKTDDDAKCREHVAAFLDALGDEGSPKWKALEDTLSEEQKAQVMKAIELLTEQP